MTRRCHRAFAAPILMFAATAACSQSPSAVPDEAFFQRAATCAAAMEIDQQILVARARGGTPGLRPELVQLTQLGFAYVGSAYLRGLRNPRGDAMLAAARVEEHTRAAADHVKLVATCRTEAAVLLYEATSLEQWLVNNRAEARVDRYLAASRPATPESAASR